MCWFGVGGSADVLFIPADVEDLQDFLLKVGSSVPITVIGVGSNLLIRDNGIRGVVIRLGAGFNYIKRKEHRVIAGAAVLDLNVAQYCLEYAISGLEFLAGIPGTIGGALYMNAGAYHSDISNILIEAKAINLQGKLKVFKKSDLGYKYRSNGLSESWIFIEGSFQGQQGEYNIIDHNIKNIQNSRLSIQPIKSKTGGSTFKNPPGLPAWKLIDEAGCRGLRIGGAEVSTQHCNFFINSNSATASDLEKLIKEVRNRVLEKTGVLLEPEVKIIGEDA
ncbi:UDP-N-acetylenolpyruvoylglucosamine reductase [Candidatus Midichloria mitochondrii IricVA]|uniref:UDP-N-acetylenolpyruvoylglucosamine reductase n=2 Tax=Candidatus Midichloria mitochondrii TaxID=234827 RepID=F7XWI7_MIDMI|nr:UDP-N-acetylenolpyruvoylglucosamine reductase [Candidatus Midichloria mitochondrii IricVA]